MKFQQPGRLIAVTVCVACAFAPIERACADVVSADYAGSNSFNYVLTGMADLDQRRDNVPNNGNFYCVPTATLDLMAYIANHGFPQVAPGNHPWQSQSLYNTATGHEILLGVMMGTNATAGSGSTGGTGSSGMLAGTKAWLGSNLYLFNINTYLKTSDWAPTIQNLAQAATSGELVNFTYGRYQYLSQNSTTAFVASRTGGHRVVLVKAQTHGNGQFVIGVRDPADEPDKPDPKNPQPSDNPNWLTTQSPFSNRLFNFARNVRVISPTSGFDRTMTALEFPLSNPDTDSRFLFIDSYMTIVPKYGVTWTNTDGLKIRHAVRNNLLGSPPNFPTHWDIPAGSVLDLVPSPDDTRIAFLHQLLLAPATAKLQVLNPSTGGIQTVAELPGAAGVVYGRGRECYVLQKTYGATNEGTNRIVYLDVETDPDILPDPILDTADLPARYLAMTYRDSDDKIIVLSGPDRAIKLFQGRLTSSQATATYNIPTSIVVSNSSGSIAVNPVDGGIWFTMPVANSPSVHHVEPGSPPVYTSVPIPGVSTTYSMSFDDMGHMYVSTNVGLIEMAKNGGVWQQVQSPYFQNPPMNIGARFNVSTSRTNYDPAQHGGPDWLDFDPILNTEGDVLIDCAGDFDDDRDVDVDDLLGLINAWGPCAVCLHDLNNDRTINVDDLLFLINSWGDCPE